MAKVIESLNFGCYPGFCLFCCGFEYEEIIKELTKQKSTGWLNAISFHEKIIKENTWLAIHAFHGSKHYYFIILKEQFKFRDSDFCKLAHEILHICQFFLPDVLKRDNEIEAEAYFHTHLMEQCLTVLRGKKK